MIDLCLIFGVFGLIVKQSPEFSNEAGKSYPFYTRDLTKSNHKRMYIIEIIPLVKARHASYSHIENCYLY